MLSGLFGSLPNKTSGFSPLDSAYRLRCTTARASAMRKSGRLSGGSMGSASGTGTMVTKPSQRTSVSSISNSVRKRLLNHLMLIIFKL